MSLRIGANFFRRTDVKLTFWYILTFFVSTLIICSFLYLRLKHQLIKGVDRMLSDETEGISKVLSQASDPKDMFKNYENNLESRIYYPIYFRVLTEKGNILFSSKTFKKAGYDAENLAFNNAKRGKQVLEYVHIPGRTRPFRFITTPYFREGKLTYVIQMGTHLRFVRKSLSHFKWNLIAAFPIVLILGTLGGWLLARRSLSPIGYIASKTRRITSKNLNERLVSRGTGDEMDDLIRTINEMISRLEDAFKGMAEFTADVSHELKTPICALKGEAEVFLSKNRTSEEYQEGLSNIIERLDHMNRMINDFILLSKLDSSKMELNVTALRLDQFIGDICNLFQILAEQKGITLKVEASQEVTIIGDKLRLQQLFTNLIENAIKYTPQGSIRIAVKKGGGTAFIAIQDTGVGIPKEEQENIFKRFYRVDKSRSRETGGVGLGLSIATCIAQAHHGKIQVQSDLGRGTTFTVTLPLHGLEDR